MSESWKTYRRRAAALSYVLTDLDGTLSTEIPWDASLSAVFTGPEDVLVAVHDLWNRRLGARVELALETDNGSLAESVAAAWLAVADQLPGARRLLDAHAGDVVLARAEQSEHRLVAVAAGLATLGDPTIRSANAGARFVAEVREGDHDTRAEDTSFVARLRYALTA